MVAAIVTVAVAAATPPGLDGFALLKAGTIFSGRIIMLGVRAVDLHEHREGRGGMSSRKKV